MSQCPRLACPSLGYATTDAPLRHLGLERPFSENIKNENFVKKPCLVGYKVKNEWCDWRQKSAEGSGAKMTYEENATVRLVQSLGKLYSDSEVL